MDKAGVSFPQPISTRTPWPNWRWPATNWSVSTRSCRSTVDQEAAALGAQVDWGDRERMPDVKDFPNADFSDVAVPADLLEKPACRVVLDALSILRRHVGGKAAVIGKVMGPWTLSYHMAGTQNFLLAVGMGEEAKVTKMLRQLMPVTIAFINAQFAAGADIVVLADHATRNLVGPHHYEQYLLPIHQEITAQAGGPLILHVCGNCSDRLELFAAPGWTPTTSSGQVDSRRRCGGSEIRWRSSATSTTPRPCSRGHRRTSTARRATRSRPG